MLLRSKKNRGKFTNYTLFSSIFRERSEQELIITSRNSKKILCRRIKRKNFLLFLSFLASAASRN